MTKHTISVLLAVGVLTMFHSSQATAEGPSTNYQAGDYFRFEPSTRKSRCIDLIAEQIQDNDTRVRSAVNNALALEIVQRDLRRTNSYYVNNIGAIVDAVLQSSYSRKASTVSGGGFRGVANQPVTLVSSDKTNSPRANLFGLSSYAGFHDVMGVPGTYCSGLAADMVAGYFIVELDAFSQRNHLDNFSTDVPTVAGQATGLKVDILNGIGSQGKRGVRCAGNVVGIDIGLQSRDNTNSANTAEMKSWTGVKVNAPKDHLGNARVSDLVNMSYGIFIEGVGSADPQGNKFIGLYSGAPAKFASDVTISGKQILEPGTFIYSNSVSQLTVSKSVHKIQSFSNLTLSNPLNAGVEGQQVTLVNIGNPTLTFQDSGSLNLQANRTLGLGDTLTLLCIQYSWGEQKWVELSYCNN